MACSVSPFLIVLIATFMAFSSSFALGKNLPSSTISAAPALLPDRIAPSLSASPALSPDISPLFPSPRGSELSPSDSSLPLIPSSPSPPNPDAVVGLGPGVALSPPGISQDSSSVRVDGFLSSSVVVLFWGILVIAGL
ncbi:hypothetical protein CDL12_20680 [Handroanthus impetiginosus]|uniref:Non-specific serine/threonine protein kinase n=1 Tax=Handroanthus impetiginosus TaxID=429701 RepID=A0A2G9GN83_9LAMI|nr:hypothetical protein CDL12_20680 [Handroanthus impetiginosus]